MYTTQKQVRAAFFDWCDSHGVAYKPNKSQNEQPTDTRMAFCDYVDYLANCGAISEALASRVTL